MNPSIDLAENQDVQRMKWFAIAGCAAVMLWSIPGLFVNPDFGIGDDATSELFFGVDMNGWHAVSGFAVVIPVLVAFRWPRVLPFVMLAAAGGLILTAIWAMFSTSVAGGLFYFPNRTGDVLLHLAVSSIFLAGALTYLLSPSRVIT